MNGIFSKDNKMVRIEKRVIFSYGNLRIGRKVNGVFPGTGVSGDMLIAKVNLMEKQNESLLLTLWTALRMFEERKKLLQKAGGTLHIDRRQQELEKHISTPKTLLTDIQKIVQ